MTGSAGSWLGRNNRRASLNNDSSTSGEYQNGINGANLLCNGQWAYLEFRSRFGPENAFQRITKPEKEEKGEMTTNCLSVNIRTFQNLIARRFTWLPS